MSFELKIKLLLGSLVPVALIVLRNEQFDEAACVVFPRLRHPEEYRAEHLSQPRGARDTGVGVLGHSLEKAL